MYRSVSKTPASFTYLRGLVDATSTICIAAAKQDNATDRPNVVFIICDDLNDYIEGFGGHPQTITPNMERLLIQVCDLRKPIATFRFVGLLEHACFQVSTHTTQAAMDLQNGTPMRYSKILARSWIISA